MGQPVAQYRTIRNEAADGVGTLTLDRPERLNGMTGQMLHEAHECLLQVAEDGNVRVVVLTGAGKGFCPGADLKHYTGAEAEAEVGLADEGFRVPLVLHEIPQVTVAATNGACAGAGLPPATSAAEPVRSS